MKKKLLQKKKKNVKEAITRACCAKFPILPAKNASLDNGVLCYNGRSCLGIDLRKRICEMFGVKNIEIGKTGSSVCLTVKMAEPRKDRPRKNKLARIKAKTWYLSDDDGA